jgi:Protein of unknown function (DUF2442)
MTSSTIELHAPPATQVSVTDEVLTVELADGRTLSVPIVWFPRLANGTREERSQWRLIGLGEGIHWPALDEDISVAGLLAGKPSGESQRSLKRWLEQRQDAARLPS